jgi:4-alpha-glucanotransferase
VSRAIRAVASVKWGAKAKEVAASLKAQHAAGRDGDDSPAEPVWPTPKEQLEALKKVFQSSSRKTATADADAAADESSDEESLDRDAEHVAQALRGVDWGQVRAATSERSTEVARTMRSLADHVDWAKVQPVAAQVSSALIAAVAAGRIPVGGPLGSMVARAITDQNNLGNRVAANLQRRSAGAPPDFRPTIRGAIEATATEA